ncbi:MAG TPA: DUF4232 domain-containing protein, partial [Acidimicrobiales bacterium]|nr:DUF4232 domain-containing protein [Acidimicrobiales bacterium]
MRAKAWFLLLLLAGCGRGSSGSTADPVAAPPLSITERCHAAQLQARIASAAASTTVFSLTDTANVACVLEGYVRFELLDRDGAALDVQPTRLTDVPIRRLTVAPGGMATFELHSRTTTAGGAP